MTGHVAMTAERDQALVVFGDDSDDDAQLCWQVTNWQLTVTKLTAVKIFTSFIYIYISIIYLYDIPGVAQEGINMIVIVQHYS